MTSFRGFLGQSWNSEISAILPYESQEVISSIMAKLQMAKDIHSKFYIFRCIFFNILSFANIKEVKINRACENFFLTINIIHAMDTVLDCAPQVWSY